jgi:hypothetical protein
MGTFVGDDPASLRHAASQLRHRAEVFMDVAAQVDGAVPTMVYVGPAGDHYRGSIGSTSASLRGTCDRILDLADRLVREADRIEAERRSAAATGHTYVD